MSQCRFQHLQLTVRKGRIRKVRGVHLDQHIDRIGTGRAVKRVLGVRQGAVGTVDIADLQLHVNGIRANSILQGRKRIQDLVDRVGEILRRDRFCQSLESAGNFAVIQSAGRGCGVNAGGRNRNQLAGLGREIHSECVIIDLTNAGVGVGCALEQRDIVEIRRTADAVNLSFQLRELTIQRAALLICIDTVGRLRCQRNHAIEHIVNFRQRTLGSLDQIDTFLRVILRTIQAGDLEAHLLRNSQTRRVISRAIDLITGSKLLQVFVQRCCILFEIALRVHCRNIIFDTHVFSPSYPRIFCCCAAKASSMHTSTR